MPSMDTKGDIKKQESLICCADCKYFKRLHNKKGHNSPHALGRCMNNVSWDGNRGQWPMFRHSCRWFLPNTEEGLQGCNEMLKEGDK